LILGFDVRQTLGMISLQQIRGHVPASDLVIIECEFGIMDVAANHLVGVGEIVLVVAVGAAECSDRRDGIAPAASSTCALLVVGPGGGMLRRDTPDRVPMSIPTSIVVVQDNTFLAKRQIQLSKSCRSRRSMLRSSKL
jgi:hypothetical protein